jgi:hypothetical protein
MSTREITENGANIKLVTCYGTKMEFGLSVEDTSKPYIVVTATREGKELVNGKWAMIYDKFNPVLRSKLSGIVAEMLSEVKLVSMTQEQHAAFDASRAEIKNAMNL